MQKIKITNSQECVIIDIEGTIGVPEQWQFEEPQQRVATYETFRQTLQQIEQLNSSEVVVNIRSTGGDVNDALLIYEALISLNASITTRCYGYVASAATVIAQAASEGLREISANALYLVHNSQCAVEGTAQELSQRIDLLHKTDERLAELYAERSGGEASVFAELMAEQSGAGRWLNAQEAIEIGLADRLIENGQASEVAEATEAEESSEESAAGEPSVIERALTHVNNVVARIGAHLKINGSKETQEETQEETETEEKTEEETEKKTTQQETTPDTKQSSSQSEVTIQSRNKASQIALEEGQKSIKKSKVAPHEDPSLSEVRRSANYEAYDRDARRLK